VHSGTNPHARVPPGIIDGSMGFYQTSSQQTLPPGLLSPVQSTPAVNRGIPAIGWHPLAAHLAADLALSEIIAGRRASWHLSVRSSGIGRLATVAGRSRTGPHQCAREAPVELDHYFFHLQLLRHGLHRLRQAGP
jgi:hypothetical protein